MNPVPPYIEIVVNGKTRALLRFSDNDWPWHRYEVRFSDLTENEWKLLHDGTVTDEFHFVMPTYRKTNDFKFTEQKCNSFFIGVPKDRKSVGIRSGVT